MSSDKKIIRKRFRDSVFTRDKYKCRCCGFDSKGDESLIDAHHIINRTKLPNGGYVRENGITVCHPCHEKCEVFHSTGEALVDFSPNDLYNKIGSTFQVALIASQKLKV